MSPLLPKSYVVAKWTVYGLATMLLFFLQYLLLDHLHFHGLTPFIYPMLPAVVASYEGLRRGGVFGLAVGLVCDLLLTGPFYGFFTLAFTLIALLAALIGENLLSPGFLCALCVSAMALLLTGALRILFQLLSGGGYLGLMARIALEESLLSLPALAAVLPLYRLIHRRCAVDY